MHTGYPVIVVAEIVVQATTGVVERERVEYISIACILVARNNKIINLIAKYFSTILHELTVISTLQTNAA